RTFDATGRHRSFRARRISIDQPSPRSILTEETPKNLTPAGYKMGGLVMAEGLALQVLQRGSWPDWCRKRQLVVVEGEPDFLTRVSMYSDADEDAPAVMGVMSGSWTAEMAARVPDGTEVIIRTDNDSAGETYAEKIIASLTGRCPMRRAMGVV